MKKNYEKLQTLSHAAGKMLVYLEGLSKRGGPLLFNILRHQMCVSTHTEVFPHAVGIMDAHQEISLLSAFNSSERHSAAA